MTSRALGVIPEIDYPIMRELPKEGEHIGLKPIGATVKALTRRFPELTASEIAGRLKSWEFHGLVVSVHTFPLAEGLGWQITQAGQDRLANATKEVSA